MMALAKILPRTKRVKILLNSKMLGLLLKILRRSLKASLIISRSPGKASFIPDDDF